MEGYIKLHRKILENPVVFKTNDHFCLWIYLLLTATHKEYDTWFDNKRFKLLPGQLITGIIKLETILNINKSKIQRILKLYENNKQIKQQTTNKGRLITILGWQKYQLENNNEIQNDKPIKIKRKLYNNTNNSNNNIYIEQMFEKFWQIYPRKVGKKNAYKSFVKIKNININYIINAIHKYKNTEQWSNIKYIPHPATWLNQERWKDENISDKKTDVINQVVKKDIKIEKEIIISKEEQLEIDKEKRKLMENFIKLKKGMQI